MIDSNYQIYSAQEVGYRLGDKMGKKSLYTAEEAQDRRNYSNHRLRAKYRNIDWEFTYETWIRMWIDSGHYLDRGCKRGNYCMARKGPDIGPYSPDNVIIQLSTENNSDGHKGNRHTLNLTTEQRLDRSKRMSAWRKGKAPWNKIFK